MKVLFLTALTLIAGVDHTNAGDCVCNPLTFKPIYAWGEDGKCYGTFCYAQANGECNPVLTPPPASELLNGYHRTEVVSNKYCPSVPQWTDFED